MRVEFDTTAAERAIKELGNRAPRAIARGINRTLSNAKVAVSREIADGTRLKVSTVKDRIGIREAAPGRLVGQVTASAKRIPLYEFSPRPQAPPSRGKGRGVTVKLPGSQGRYPHAFIAKVGRGGHLGVFERKPGRGRLPIVEKRGPSIAKVFEKHAAAGVQRYAEQLGKNVGHEIEFAAKEIRSRK